MFGVNGITSRSLGSHQDYSPVSAAALALVSFLLAGHSHGFEALFAILPRSTYTCDIVKPSICRPPFSVTSPHVLCFQVARGGGGLYLILSLITFNQYARNVLVLASCETYRLLLQLMPSRTCWQLVACYLTLLYGIVATPLGSDALASS